MNEPEQERPPTLRDGWGEARRPAGGHLCQRIEEETQLLITYINDELVPAIRDHSSKALRIASEDPAQAAEMMEADKRRKKR